MTGLCVIVESVLVRVTMEKRVVVLVELVAVVNEFTVASLVTVTVGGMLLSVNTICPLLFEEQEPRLRLLVSAVHPVFTQEGVIAFPF
jgi:hypothetical protein